jgi:hypothetical protein
MSATRTRFAAASAGILVALAAVAPSGLADTIHASSVPPPCRVVVHAPVHTGGTPGKTLATMTFTCTVGHSKAAGTVQSQELIRGRWIHQATRTITFFQVKGGRRYRVTTPPIDCSPGQYRTIASVTTGRRTARAQSHTVDITCAAP